MKTFDDILAMRRSVRSYDSRPVEEEHLVALCEAARLAPSACNSQTWRFVVVTRRDLIEKIADEGMRSVIRNDWIRSAPVLVVGCSKLDIKANRIGTLVTGIEYYQLDMGIAMEHMVLKAAELGLGTCWVGWFHERKIKQILGIPASIKVPALLTVGYPKKPLDARAKSRIPLREIVFRENWGSTANS